ncbi:MAG: glycosyltransferase family 2 protein [Hyphomicrobiaceae bacterium]
MTMLKPTLPVTTVPVSVVVVTYNSASIVLDAVHSIDPRAEIIVVDNDSTDETIERLRGAKVRVIRNDRNVGFGRACNIGAAQCARPFLFFLNPDARLRPDALDRLIRAALSRPVYAAFNPRILTPDGHQFQRKMSRLLPPELNAKLRAPLCRDQDVEMLSGAALFCRRDAFEVIGGFDEKIFLFCEDDDLSLRFRQIGMSLGYVHDAIVEHVGGASTATNPELAELRAYHLMKSSRYAMRKHAIAFERRHQLFQCALKFAAGLLALDRYRQAKYRGYLKALIESEA